METTQPFLKQKRRHRRTVLRQSRTAVRPSDDVEHLPRRHLEREHYSNCTMLGPHGQTMCRIALKRARWYLKRELAQVVQDEPLVIQLKFEPNGHGCAGDPFYLTERKNLCVVCGKTEGLTRHHCVPFCFRKHFPPDYKENTSHDILLVCSTCHEDYEKVAQPIKDALLRQAGVQFGAGSEIETLRQARRAAFAIYHYGKSLPAEREAQLRQQVGDAYGFPVTDDVVLQACVEDEEGVGLNGTELPDPWKVVVERIEDLPAFIRSWRSHFVSVMRPMHLPEHWSVEGRYQK